MKRIILIGLFFLCIIALFAQRRGELRYVNVSKADLKASTGFFADTNGTVEYGTEVSVIEVNKNNVNVETTGGRRITGWIPDSSITKTRIVRQGNPPHTATAGQIALAGKGFSAETENAYREQNKEPNFAAVDAMERNGVISGRVLEGWIEEGRLFKGETR